MAGLIEARFSRHPGELDLAGLPATAGEAGRLWGWARQRCIRHFGPYQDAMSGRSGTLFHTRISALLKLHRLTPRRVVEDVARMDVPLASQEGCIRQVLGWRQFVHHVHEATNGFRRLPGRRDPRTAEAPGDGGRGRWSGKAWRPGPGLDGGARPWFLGATAALPPARRQPAPSHALRQPEEAFGRTAASGPEDLRDRTRRPAAGAAPTPPRPGRRRRGDARPRGAALSPSPATLSRVRGAASPARRSADPIRSGRPASASSPLRLGISTCLLGENVRWDGGHKRDRFVTEVLGPFVEWVPVCPEVEVGMGIPRESVRLVRRDGEVRMVAPKSGTDWTARMRRYARARVRVLRKLHLVGYVLKRDSPSCGMERVRVYGGRGGMAERKGRGLFAEALLEAFPHLPVEEEGRLNDPVLRESFIERVFAYRRLQEFFARRWSVGDLVRFHTAHKLQVMAHSPQAYRELGRLVAEAKALPRRTVHEQYAEEFMAALEKRATSRRHVNAMQHMVGFFRELLDARDKRELLDLIEDYRQGLVPLVVPLTLIRHHVDHFGVDYLQGQHYLEPHPKELMLRNHV